MTALGDWKCCGCGKPGRIRSCDCATRVVYRGREQASKIEPEDAILGAALARAEALVDEVAEGVPAICDTPLFASYEFAADFKLIVEAARRDLSERCPDYFPTGNGEPWQPPGI